MRTFRTWLMLVALVVVLPLTGCGSKEADSTGGGSEPAGTSPEKPGGTDNSNAGGGGGA